MYFSVENVCVELMQNSSVGRTAGYNSLPCMVPGSSPGSAPIPLWICVFIGIIRQGIPNRDVLSKYNYNMDKKRQEEQEEFEEVRKMFGMFFKYTPFYLLLYYLYVELFI